MPFMKKNDDKNTLGYLRLYHEDGFIESWLMSDIVPVQIVRKYLGNSYLGEIGRLEDKDCFLLFPENSIKNELRKNRKATKIVRDAGNSRVVYGPALVFDSTQYNIL